MGEDRLVFSGPITEGDSRMKKILMLAVGLALVASVASAQSSAAGTGASTGTQGKSKSAQKAGKGTTTSVAATVKSIDAAGKKIELDIAGQPATVNLTGKAVTAAAKFKTGDKVTVTLHDNANGEHTSVSAIKATKAKKK